MPNIFKLPGKNRNRFANLFALQNLPKKIKNERYSELLHKLNQELLDDVFKQARKADIPEPLLAYAFWAELTKYFSLDYPETAERLRYELLAIMEAHPWVPPF